MSGAPHDPRATILSDTRPEPAGTPRATARSLLPGAVILAVLLAVSLFAAGYTLGDGGA